MKNPKTKKRTGVFKKTVNINNIAEEMEKNVISVFSVKNFRNISIMNLESVNKNQKIPKNSEALSFEYPKFRNKFEAHVTVLISLPE